MIKSLLAAAPGLSPFNVLDREAAHQAALFASDDFAEGIAAFREKRRAVFGDERRSSRMTTVKPPDLGVQSSSRVAPLIKQDKVHGSLYTDPAIFAEELHKIWYRTWVFVGHES